MVAALALLAAFLQPQDEDEKIRRCVRQLGSDEPRQREEATQELVRLGERVLKAVRASHQESRDAETRARLDEVVRKIRQETAVTPERLRTTIVDLAMAETTWAGVAGEIQRRTGIPIRLEIPEDVSLGAVNASRASVEWLLQRLCTGGLLWAIDRDEAVVVTTREGYLSRFSVNRSFDVRDLLQEVQRADRLRLGALSPGDAGPIAGETVMLLSGEALCHRIVEQTPDRSWDSDWCNINATDGTVRVRNLPAVCDDVDRAIARLRETVLTPVRIRVTAVAVRESAADALREGGDRLKEALAAGKDATLLAEQEVSAFKDVPTFIYSGRESPFIAEYTPAGDPVRHLLREGLAISLRATPSGEGKKFRLTGDLSLCRLEKMERFAVKQGDIQLPTISMSAFRIESHPSVDQTELALSQGGCSFAGKELSRVMVFVRVSRKP